MVVVERPRRATRNTVDRNSTEGLTPFRSDLGPCVFELYLTEFDHHYWTDLSIHRSATTTNSVWRITFAAVIFCHPPLLVANLAADNSVGSTNSKPVSGGLNGLSLRSLV